MTILETLIALRDNIKVWCVNNFSAIRSDMTAGDEKAVKELVVTNSASNTENNSSTGVYVNAIGNGSVKSSFFISGSGATGVSCDEQGNIIIRSSNTDTTYTAGNGLTLTGNSFSVNTGYSSSGRNYGVQTDDKGNLYVIVPWTDSNTDTTYTLSISGKTITLQPSSGTPSSIELPVYQGTYSLQGGE